MQLVADNQPEKKQSDHFPCGEPATVGAGQQQQGKSEPPPPGCQAERRRILSETLPAPARIINAANTFSKAAAKIFLEAAYRTALSFERLLNPAFDATIRPEAMEMIGAQIDAHRRAMRDAYMTAAAEMLKMIGGDYEPESWDFGEEPSAGESSKLRTEEERICDLYHELTEPPPKKG